MRVIIKEYEIYAELIRVMECALSECSRNSVEYYIYSFYVENQFSPTTSEECLEKIYEIVLTIPNKQLIPISVAEYVASLSDDEHNKLREKMEDTIGREYDTLLVFKGPATLRDCISLFKRHADIVNKIDKYNNINNAILIYEKLKECLSGDSNYEFEFACILARLNALTIGLAWLNGNMPTIVELPKGKAINTLNYIYERLMQINAVLGINVIDKLCVLLREYMKENDEVIDSILKSLHFFKIFFDIDQFLSLDYWDELSDNLPVVERSVRELRKLCELAERLEDSITPNTFRESLYQSQLFNTDLFIDVASNLNMLGMIGVLDRVE